MRCGKSLVRSVEWAGHREGAASMIESDIDRETTSRRSTIITSPRAFSHPRSFRLMLHSALGPTLSCRSDCRAVAMTVEAYLQQHRLQHISWHFVLNNHASTRPKTHGGQIVPSITPCKTYSAPGPASAVWECTLDMPHWSITVSRWLIMG